MSHLRLNPDVGVRVGFVDRTPFGSPIGGRPEASVSRLFGTVGDHFGDHGLASLLRAGPSLLDQVVQGSAFAALSEREGSSWKLHPAVLFPDPGLAPAHDVTFFRSGGTARVRATVPGDHWRALRDLVGRLASGGCDRADPALAEPMGALLGGLLQAGLVSEGDLGPDRAVAPGGPGLTFVGHNTVVVRSARSAVVVDPFLFPHDAAYPPSYQPLRVGDLGPVDAVLITHSHPDHFDPGSLLQLAPGTRIVVPALERETLLAVDMAARLAELGFDDVTVLPWGQSLAVGDIEVTALPFFGEQPTDGEVLHPEVRNNGNTYLVRTPEQCAVFLADSGRDQAGDVKHLAEEWHRRLGPVDVVFSGYRGWVTYPIQLVLSSVGRYILFVPPGLWESRMRLMSDAHDAVDVAERWGARWLVPYADGGAPWYWRVGLGPRLDGSGEEHPDFDPVPERVVAAARERIQDRSGAFVGSRVGVQLLRPGDSLLDLRTSPRRHRVPGNAWCYPEDRELSSLA